MSNPDAVATERATGRKNPGSGERPPQAEETPQVVNFTVEEAEGLNRMLQATVENFTAQSKINDQLVSRLLDFEKKLADLDAQVRRALEAGTRERLPLYMGNSLALCRILDSFLMYVDTRDTRMTPHLLLEGCWKPAQTRVMSRLVTRGMRVVEVGAQTGYFTLLAAAGTGPEGQVVALEPETRTFELLNLNVQVNGLAHRVRTLTVDTSNGGGIAERAAHRKSRGPASRPMPETFAPLDELIPDPIDVLLLDAQGNEPQVFAGMRGLLPRSPHLTILLEFAPTLLERSGNSPREFLCALRAAGFEIRAITPQASTPAIEDAALLASPASTLLLDRS